MAIAKKIVPWSSRLLQARNDSPEVGWVSVAELHVDRDLYQRPINDIVKRIVADFDPHLLGTILVSRRGDGSLWVLDGQHRVEALRELGQQVVLATIYEHLTPPEEAAAFYQLNTARRSPNTWQKFKARLAANDRTALAIVAIAEECGLRASLTPNRSVGNIAALASLEYIYNSTGGPALLRFVLTRVRSIWPQDVPAYDGEFLIGLAVFAHSWGEEIDWDRFDEVMSKIPAINVTRRAREYRIETARGMTPALYAIALRDIYNGKARNRRLTGSPLSIKTGRRQGWQRGDRK